MRIRAVGAGAPMTRRSWAIVVALALVALGLAVFVGSRGAEDAGLGEDIADDRSAPLDASPRPAVQPQATPTPSSEVEVEPEADPDAARPVASTAFLRFDGVDDYVDLNRLEIDGSEFTIEAWVNSEELRNCPDVDCRILSKATGVADDDHAWMLSTIGVDEAVRLRFRLRVSGSTATLIASSGDLLDATWYHVAATYDGSHMRIFLDGAEVGARDVSGPITDDTDMPVWVGGNPSGESDRPWRGSIDDLRIWNVARTSSELTASMGDELAGNDLGLVAYYRFNTADRDLDLVAGGRAILGSEVGADSNDPTTLVGHDSTPEPNDSTEPASETDAEPGSEPAADTGPSTGFVGDIDWDPGLDPDWDPDSSGGVCTFTNGNEPTDDPNPDFDGSLGRFPVSSAPIPPGYPTPLTTGLCGVGLTPADLTVSPGITIEEDGAVYDGYDFTGSVVVEADNVTIRNSRITSSGFFPLHLRPGFTNLLVEDTRIRGVGEDVSNAVYLQNAGATLRRVHASGGSDGFKPTSGDFVLEDSYYAGSYRRQGTEGSGSGSHNDVIQIRAGSNYTIRHNTLLGPFQMSTSAIIAQAKAGDISHVVIANNYLSGGGYTVYTTATDPYSLSDTIVENNRFERESWLHGSVRNSGGATYINNAEIPS